ncbi:hypothetical protein SCBWM1_gp66 [Synechococcus phage S-CBWM1]|uniref:Uncharacterized protein n=1 Tax=Synechococcus phage S-CBWM1 TaxID=2053653 RepID=A0A3G1L3M8_9CAUD|nr:hypothetical protein HOU61_gp131 [Synechococcus phage S-CBWM1]ATW62750.1 hypothetical protein SCBWM1_gp66 [Synechococcus phage S-CBWM1]
MSAASVRIARKELVNRGYKVRGIRESGKFIVRNEAQVAERDLYETLPSAYTAEEMVTIAGALVLKSIQKINRL